MSEINQTSGKGRMESMSSDFAGNISSPPQVTEHGSDSASSFVMERFGNLSEMDRSFDIEFWQRQGDAAIFNAAWELVELYYQERGFGTDELRLQRSVENFQR